MPFRLFSARFAAALLCAGLAAAAAVRPAQAQFTALWNAGEVQRGQRTNLFAHWEGQRALGAVVVELPPQWRLAGAVALRRGHGRTEMEVQRFREGSNAYLVRPPSLLDGAVEIVLQAEVAGSIGAQQWAVVPVLRAERDGRGRFAVRQGLREERSIRLVEPVRARDNLVLAFQGGGAPWRLRRSALPDLGARAAFTVEFWMRTTDLDEVLLSAWDGREQVAYPLEIVVDAAGRLRYFRGQPGRHESMASTRPVADGQWHHVAVTHDGTAGWTRLFLDGDAADSLYSPVPPLIVHRTALALGARLPARAGGATPAPPDTGLIDELRLWPFARTPADLRRTMRQPLDAPRGAVVLSFEEPPPRAVVEATAPRTDRVASDLAFYRPVHDVQAVLEGAVVVLSWRSEDPHTRAFAIERSTDGRTFEPVGEVDAAEPVPGEPGTYRFQDPGVADEVVFYRIRQRFESGAERLSGTIKLGLGRDAPQDVLLVGNFPNPFNPQTTITYEVRKTQRVRLSVWDLAGQLVTVLADRVQPPGTYQVAFSGNDLPSGSYFVRLETPSSTQAHMMVLAK